MTTSTVSIVLRSAKSTLYLHLCLHTTLGATWHWKKISLLRWSAALPLRSLFLDRHDALINSWTLQRHWASESEHWCDDCVHDKVFCQCLQPQVPRGSHESCCGMSFQQGFGWNFTKSQGFWITKIPGFEEVECLAGVTQRLWVTAESLAKSRGVKGERCSFLHFW